MRLDKFIGNNTQYSRKDARKLLKSGRIQVNGERVADPDTAIKSNTDIIALDGVHIEPIGKLYLMVNKPKGVVSVTEDNQHPTVIDLLRDEKNLVGKKKNKALPFRDLQIAGRLDIDTTGLVLVTNDGKWNHRITSPASGCKKTYCVTLAETLSPSVQEKFASGVQLEGEKHLTRPAVLHRITPKKVRLSLSEGKYHQVKRMFAAVGNHVTALHRESVAGLTLDANLAPGQYRFLTAEELEIINANVSRSVALL